MCVIIKMICAIINSKIIKINLFINFKKFKINIAIN